MGAMSLFSSASSSKLSSPFSPSSPSSSASLDIGLPKAKTVKIASTSPWFEETKGRIAKLFDKNEITISTYDTAWVAMVPSPFSSTEPCFPDSLHWLLENQCHDGSWARPHHHSLLKKDVLSSTLASVLALKKWGLGQQHIDKGLQFVESNFGWAVDESQITPIGFEIIFPGMLDQARALSLNPSFEQSTLNHVMNLRDLELKRIYSSTDKEAYMAYISEGLMGNLQHESIDMMKYQRKNGSLFNSPSSTAAAAFTALPNYNCLNYLNLVVNKFGGAVPAVYPLDIYSQLCTFDNLERLGISQYFETEIRNTLDQIYRCWLLGDEEIFMDASTCALAFKILRMHGYNVTSDVITKVLQESFPASIPGRTPTSTDVNTALELFRASQLMLHPHETELENQNSRLRSILERDQLPSASIQSSQLAAEVKQALEYPFHAVLDRMATRQAIEHYNFDSTRILKTSYCLPGLGSTDLLHLSVEDFNRCQAIHRTEFREYERWLVENRLDEVEVARHKAAYCYFSAASALSAPHLSHARMAWAQNALLATLIDDLFDFRGSHEEINKLIHLLQLWDIDVITKEEEEEHGSSHDVHIIFLALKSTIRETVDKGSKLQGRNIASHIIAIWLDLMYSFMKEVEWREEQYIPTLDEYMSNACVSIGLGPIVLLPLYLLGPKISEEMVNHSSYHDLFKAMSTCGRLLNDIRGYEREAKQGKLCAIQLYIAENGGEMSTEDAISEIKRSIDVQRRELLRLVLEENNNASVVPRECKELFWHMSSVLHLFYNKDDGYASKELFQVLNDVIHRPIVLEEF